MEGGWQMAKTCSELLRGMDGTIVGDAEMPILGLAFDSRAAKPGFLFFCIVGTVTDGHRFAQDAVDRGAVAVVVERELELTPARGWPAPVQLVVADSRRAMAHISARFYDNPSRAFQLVGITGTNGKTTVSYLVDHIVEASGLRSGLIGTVGNKVGGVEEKAQHTTPESMDLQHLLARMRDAGAEVVAMEVSSHALDLRRTWACDFAVTAFTNLTQDHLDYHRTLEAYFEAKALLFGPDYPAKRVINIDGPHGRELMWRCFSAGDDILTTGFSSQAYLHPLDVEYGVASTEVELAVGGLVRRVAYPLVGRFNVENVLTAVGICLQLGLSLDAVLAALADVPAPPGRLERVRTAHDGGISIFVDYAHTPDALEKALASVMALQEEAAGREDAQPGREDAQPGREDAQPGRTIVVFGCGGERDTGKRPLMGRAALAADHVVVTSDNPRHDDPSAIIADIVAGMADEPGAAGRYEVEPDRRAAIARAIRLAAPGDCILLAGKGHEDYQLVGDEVLPFDDRVVAAEELERAFGGEA